MLKLNTKDIVKRATQLADLENSDFISWNENIQMMNEAYQKIYQKIINHDDKTFMVRVNLTLPLVNGNNEIHYALPDNFYQLYSLTDIKTGKCVVKKSINEPINSLRYDIVNDELIIYGNHSLTLQMTYFPIPATLSLKAKDVSFDIPDKIKLADYADVCDKKIVYTVSNNLYIYDIDTESLGNYTFDTSWITAPDAIAHFIAGKYGFIVITKQGNLRYYDYSDPGNYTYAETGKPILLTKDKRMFIIIDNAIKEFIDGGSLVKIKALEDFASLFEYGIGFIDEYDMGYYINHTDDTIVYRFSISGETFVDSSFRIEAGSNYILDDKYICNKVLFNLKNELIDTGVTGINKIDDETGYGYTLNTGVIRGIFDNTEIEYPNNLFIQLISYYMAIQYKSKQNAECSGLIALYQNAEEQFYDSIGRDDYQYTRIQNVY